MSSSSAHPFVAIACGGTGGHLFPGMAVAQELRLRGCDVSLLISPKEVDQQAVKSAVGLEIVTLPAVALNRGQGLGFARGFVASFRASRNLFRQRRPQAVLGMGGFTSAPPVIAGKLCGAATAFHESNAIPGRANRWLAHVVDEGFVGFASATNHLFLQRITTTGTPVRAQFQPQNAEGCRAALGLDARRPVLLVMGGSQGATGVNDIVLAALPALARLMPELQFLHLSGAGDFEKVGAAYATQKLKAIVRPFLAEMELALGAASAAISRAGASTMTELAAMRLPAILIPYPQAAYDHQLYNARAFAQTGAARFVEQAEATPQVLSQLVVELTNHADIRTGMARALAQWHQPQAAAQIAARLLRAMGFPEASSHPGRIERAPVPATGAIRQPQSALS